MSINSLCLLGVNDYCKIYSSIHYRNYQNVVIYSAIFNLDERVAGALSFPIDGINTLILNLFDEVFCAGSLQSACQLPYV